MVIEMAKNNKKTIKFSKIERYFYIALGILIFLISHMVFLGLFILSVYLIEKIIFNATIYSGNIGIFILPLLGLFIFLSIKVPIYIINKYYK